MKLIERVRQSFGEQEYILTDEGYRVVAECVSGHLTFVITEVDGKVTTSMAIGTPQSVQSTKRHWDKIMGGKS